MLGWQAYQYRWLLPWLPFIGAPSRYDIRPEIQLEPKWEQTFEQKADTMVSISAVTIAASFQQQPGRSADIRTDRRLWANASLTTLVFQGDSEQPDFSAAGSALRSGG